jgi:hypothetical protein
MLGSGSRGNHIHAVPILKKYKDSWPSVKNNREVQIHMAFAIGWLTHRAADRRLKLIFAEHENDPDPLYTNDSCRIYQDTMTFRKVYDGGKLPSLSPKEVLSPATFDYNMQSLPATQGNDVLKSEPLITRMWLADMVNKQSFMNKTDNFDEWVSTFVDRYQYMTEDFRRYEEAYNNPDPVLAKRYFDDDNYYDDADEIIQYVRHIQKGKESSINLLHAVEKAENQSLYAQVLRQGYYYIKGASDFFTGKINEEALWKILNKKRT